HLVLQSRSARAAVLVPAVIPLAVAAGLNPAAVVFASTAAAGFCHTLTSSAKPVAMFSDLPDGTPTYRRSDLLRLSALLGPLVVALAVSEPGRCLLGPRAARSPRHARQPAAVHAAATAACRPVRGGPRPFSGAVQRAPRAPTLEVSPYSSFSPFCWQKKKLVS